MEFHFQKIKEPSVMWFSVCSILIIRFLSTDSMSWKLQIYKRISTLTILFPRTISVIYLASILITVGSMFVVVWFCLFACFPKYRKERLALKCGVAILGNESCTEVKYKQAGTMSVSKLWEGALHRTSRCPWLPQVTDPSEYVAEHSLCPWVLLQKKQLYKGRKGEEQEDLCIQPGLVPVWIHKMFSV